MVWWWSSGAEGVAHARQLCRSIVLRVAVAMRAFSSMAADKHDSGVSEYQASRETTALVMLSLSLRDGQ